MTSNNHTKPHLYCYYTEEMAFNTAIVSQEQDTGYFYMNYYSRTNCTGVQTFVESYTSGVCVTTPSGSIKQTCSFRGNNSTVPRSFSPLEIKPDCIVIVILQEMYIYGNYSRQLQRDSIFSQKTPP